MIEKIDNRFILLWDGFPIGFRNGIMPFKTISPNEIAYFYTPQSAASFQEICEHPLKVREIQFVIKESK